VQWIALLTALALVLLFLVRLNVHLDKEVSARTRELAAANMQLTEANEQLKANDKMQKEFINIAAHELRTPITPILVALHLKHHVKGVDGTSQTILAEGQAEMIERNAKRLERLANDILTVTRIEGRGVELCKEAIDMNETWHM
jgi:signal transduction histidine kinase